MMFSCYLKYPFLILYKLTKIRSTRISDSCSVKFVRILISPAALGLEIYSVSNGTSKAWPVCRADNLAAICEPIV
jgi:hypothetical protein